MLQLRPLTVALTLMVALSCCTGTGSPADAGGEPTGDGDNGGVDCDTCTADQLCWFTDDENGETSDSGCLAYPAQCAADLTCDCVNASTTDSACDELGYEQNSNACSDVDGRPVLYCVSTLG